METGWKYPDRLKELKRLSHHGETEWRKHNSNNGRGGWRWGGDVESLPSPDPKRPDREMDKEDVVHIYNGMVLSHEK